MKPAYANPEFVKARLRTRFGSVFAFEDAHGLPRKSVSDVLRGRSNRKVIDTISTVLGNEPDAALADKSDSENAKRPSTIIGAAK